ncbi:MAG: HEPN domain-containing protein [Synergistaceae bacterium]|nr:HEPN domain-containing protein [Synergistaceae bacterium]
MDKGINLDLSKYRFERAKTTLDTAKNIFDYGDTNASANRSYYAVFYAMLAVTSLDGFEASKHSSVISYFNRNYVKTKIFSGSISDMIRTAFRMRTNADYEDFYKVSPDRAKIMIEYAEKVINMIQPYLEKCWEEIKNSKEVI